MVLCWSMLLPQVAFVAHDWNRASDVASLRAGRNNQECWDSLPVGCHEASASRNDR